MQTQDLILYLHVNRPNLLLITINFIYYIGSALFAIQQYLILFEKYFEFLIMKPSQQIQQDQRNKQSQLNQNTVNQSMQGFQQTQIQGMPVMNQMFIPQQMQYSPQMMMPQQLMMAPQQQMTPQPFTMQPQPLQYLPQPQQMTYNEQLKLEDQILNENTDQSKINDQSLLEMENEVNKITGQDQQRQKPQLQQMNLQSQPQFQQPQFVFVQTPQGLMQVPVINQMGNNQMTAQNMTIQQPQYQQVPFSSIQMANPLQDQPKKRSQTSFRPVMRPQRGHPLFTSTGMEETDARKTQSSRGKSLKQMRVGLPHNDRYYNKSSDFDTKSPAAFRSKSPINQRSKSNKKQRKEQDTLSSSSRNNLNFMKATLSQQRKHSEKIKVRSQIKMQLKQLNQLQEKLVKQQDAILKKKKEKKLKKELNKSKSPSKDIVKIVNHKYGGSSSERSDYKKKSKSNKSKRTQNLSTQEVFSPIKEKPPKLKLKNADKKVLSQDQKDVLSKSPKSRDRKLKSKSSKRESVKKSLNQDAYAKETLEIQTTTEPEFEKYQSQENKVELKATQKEIFEVQMPQVSSNELSSRHKKETIIISDDNGGSNQFKESKNQIIQNSHRFENKAAQQSQSKSSSKPSLNMVSQRAEDIENVEMFQRESKTFEAQLMLQNIEQESEYGQDSPAQPSPKKIAVAYCAPFVEHIYLERSQEISFEIAEKQTNIEPVEKSYDTSKPDEQKQSAPNKSQTNQDLMEITKDIQVNNQEVFGRSDENLKKKTKKDNEPKKTQKIIKEIATIKLEDSIDDDKISQIQSNKPQEESFRDSVKLSAKKSNKILLDESIKLTKKESTKLSKPAKEQVIEDDNNQMCGHRRVVKLQAPQFERIEKCAVLRFQVDTDSDDTDGWCTEMEDNHKLGSHLFSIKNTSLCGDDKYEENSSITKEEKISILENIDSDLNKINKEGIPSSKVPQKKQCDNESAANSHIHFIPGQAVYTRDISDAMRITQDSILSHVQDMQSLRDKKFLIIHSSKDPKDPGNYSYIQEYQEKVVVDNSNIIRINDKRKVYFEIFVIVLAIYNCFGIPLEICFAPPMMQRTGFTLLNSVIDLFFAIDIYIQFKTSYYDDQSGEEIMDRQTIIWNYLSGRFLIDLMATIPFDSIAYAITRQKSAILPLFSLLKLIRVTRLGRIVEKMNVKEDIKLAMKLAQLIFFLIMFIHIQACVWFKIVQTDETWQAPLDGIDPDSDLYSDTILRKYLISIYYSILLLTCNDITPQGDWKIYFCTVAITMGAIINANIFGNMALIIQNLNIKSTEFQESIDLANTAMKNLNMPSNLQKDVVAYLQYTQESQNGQQEFVYFFQALSPSLKNKVIDFLFKEKCEECEMFEGSKPLIEFFIQSLDLRLLDPEYPLINEGEEGNMFYFVRSGDLEVFVTDPVKKKEVYVRTLKGGQFFGEFALLTGQPRSASVRPKSYAKVGYFSKDIFEELIFMFPEFKQRLQDNLRTYDDVNKVWEREQLKKIAFFRYLSYEDLDELTIILVQKYYDQNEEILRHGQACDKIIILTQGVIEIYVTIPTDNGPEELILDTLSKPGCVLNQVCMLKKYKLNYSARAKTDIETMIITYDELTEYIEMTKMVGLKAQVEDFYRKTRDTSQTASYPAGLAESGNRQFFLDYQKVSKPGQFKNKDARIKFMDKMCKLGRYHRRKGNILSDLIAELKKQAMEEEQKAQGKMKEVVKSVGPIIVQKLKKLVTNRIKQVYQDSQLQSQQINNISKIISMLENQGANQGNSPPRASKQREDPSEFEMKPKSKIAIQPKMQEVKELDDEDKESVERDYDKKSDQEEQIPDSSRKLI